MSSDGFIPFVEDGTGVYDRFHVSEDVLHHPEFFVLERHFPYLEFRVGSQHPNAVVFSISFDLLFIKNHALVRNGEEAAISLVADQR